MDDVLSTLKIALQAHQSGALEKAEELYIHILKKQANQPDALHLLGALKKQQGHMDEAKGYAEKAVQLRPSMSDAWSNLAGIYLALQDMKGAEMAFQNAAKNSKETPKFHLDLVRFYQSKNNMVAAKKASENFLKYCPKAQEAWFWHSQMLAANGELEAASVVASNAVNALPQSADIFYNLGLILLKMADFDGARTATTQALNLKPHHPHLLMQMGMVEMASRNYKEALVWLEQAAGNAEVALTAYTALAEVYEKLNNAEKASEAVSKGLSLKKDAPVLLYVKALLARREGELEQAETLLKQVLSQPLPAQHKVMVMFEYGRVLDRLNRYGEAYQALVSANHLYARLSPQIEAQKQGYLSEIERLKALLPTYSAHKKLDVPHAPLVFLVGFPRSGTTLLDQILDAHTQIHVMEEQDCVTDMLAHALKDGKTAVESYDDLEVSDIKELQEFYWNRVEKAMGKRAEGMFVDKYPLNITKAIYLRKIFPEAKFIFAARHPFDVVLSNFMQSFEMNAAMANFLAIEDAVHLYDEVLDLWESTSKAADFNVHYVSYEDVVQDMEGEARKLIEFVGMEWESSVLKYRERSSSEKTIQTPSYSQVVEPIYGRAKGRWENYKDTFKPYFSVMKPHLKLLGYKALK